MAEASKSGTYVKLPCHVWYDKRNDNVHVTSNDKALPPGNLHMTAKKGTQSDRNLRVLLDDFGCGPKAAAANVRSGVFDAGKTLNDALTETIMRVETAADPADITKALEELRSTVNDVIAIEQE